MLHVFNSIYIGLCVYMCVCVRARAERDREDTCVQRNVHQNANNVYV